MSGREQANVVVGIAKGLYFSVTSLLGVYIRD
jgi:hypothetical protein